MSSTDVGDDATRMSSSLPLLSCIKYELAGIILCDPAVPHPVLTRGIGLRSRYAMSGTDLGRAPTRWSVEVWAEELEVRNFRCEIKHKSTHGVLCPLHARYAMPATDIAYAATRTCALQLNISGTPALRSYASILRCPILIYVLLPGHLINVPALSAHTLPRSTPLCSYTRATPSPVLMKRMVLPDVSIGLVVSPSRGAM
eukprot:2205946-Rhodomonas_salina.4